jgi:hypothetical protein
MLHRPQQAELRLPASIQTPVAPLEALCGPDLFLANSLHPGSVTELDASTGALVRVVVGPQYEFNYPYTLAVNGDDLFVADGFSVTELDTSTGRLVRVLFHGPAA